MNSASCVLLVASLLGIVGVRSELFSSKHANGDVRGERVKRQQSSCVNYNCKVLLGQIKARREYSRIHSETSCQNDDCEDVLDVQYLDGSRETYVCDRNGCKERGSTSGSARSRPYPPAPNEPSWAQTSNGYSYGSMIGRVGSNDNSYGSMIGRDNSYGSMIGRDNSYKSMIGRDNSYGSMIGRDNSYGSMIGRDNSYGSTVGRVGSNGNPERDQSAFEQERSGQNRLTPVAGAGYGSGDTCLSHHCRDLVSRIKLDGRHSSIAVDSSCVNSQCRDTISVVFYNGAQQIYDCDTYSCALRGNMRVPAGSTTPYRTQITDYIEKCSTVSCIDLINRLKAEVVYSSYDVSTSCGGTVCEDTITILYRDNTHDVFICGVYGCQIKAVSPPPPARPATTPAPVSDVTAEPATTTTTAVPKPALDYDEDNYESENSLTSVDTAGNTSITTTPTTPTTTTAPSTTTTITTEHTATPTTTTENPTASTQTTDSTSNSTDNAVKLCAEDSCCGGHHICFNGGCLDPCDFCGTNALCDVILDTYVGCRCPDNAPGDPYVECQLVANDEVSTSTSTTAGPDTGCLLPSDVNGKLSFCPARCINGCEGAGTNCHLEAGTVARVETVRVQCATGFVSDGQRQTLVPCHDGAWLGEFPKCLAACPPLRSDTTEVRCQWGEREVDCSESVRPGTTATFRCGPKHSPDERQRELYARGVVCNEDGRWSSALPECKPAVKWQITFDMFKSKSA